MEAVRRTQEKGGSLLVTGSFYLCAEYKKLLSKGWTEGRQLKNPK
jgi:folylpolyglutamate synthase/dihydropteroate synthase